MTELKRAIQSSGLKQLWLAEQLGVSQNTITRWANGDRPRVDQAQQLASLLNVPVEDLFPVSDSNASEDLKSEQSQALSPPPSMAKPPSTNSESVAETASSHKD